MEEKRSGKLPIDAKLLSDAVIELNISRRSVGLYPPEHPIARESIDKAFQFLRKLFELRSSITIGVAKDTLVIDEYTLERKNPVYREFALSIHRKGIAAITFYTGLERDELVGLQKLITSKEAPVGKALAERAGKDGLTHLGLIPIDISKFGFVEDSLRETGPEGAIWEDYVYGLLEGKLADSEAEGVLLALPPGNIASFLNEQIPENAPEKTYDRVITGYLRRKENSGFNRELFTRFISMVEDLNPKLKEQFLRRSFSYPQIDTKEAEELFNGLMQSDIEKVMRIFTEHSSFIPESLRNTIDKLTASKRGNGFFDLLAEEKGVVDDLEIDEEILGLFTEDGFKSFVAERYQEELERMLRGFDSRRSRVPEEVKAECRDETIDRVTAEVLIELIGSDSTDREGYLALLTKLAGLVGISRDR
ncbi:MAG: hypothetical protein M1497_13585 [Nitrospirae bacterium]|nr:hypothetical protein [Nitrospirota bacterium]